MESEASQNTLCINCKASHQFKYCPECGQPAAKRELNFRYLYREFKDSVLGFDGRFPKTLTHALRNPGAMARQFILGNRRKFIGPVGFFFVCLTVYILVMQLSGFDMKSIIQSQQSAFPQTDGDAAYINASSAIGEKLNEYFRLFSFLNVLLLGVFLYLFNIKKGATFIQHMVYAFYVQGFNYLVSIGSLLIVATGNILLASIYAASLPLVYQVHSYTTYDRSGGWIKRSVKGLAIFGCVIISVFILTFAATVIYLANNPDLMELFTKEAGKN
ncbi:MAG: DUF3667 domain-containing protein [Cryomorphaceae bacterium]|nr:DUF3667 domain-containing protein [Flavobacteriales bacterium]